MWFDTHAHLTDEQLLPELQAVIDRAKSSRVSSIVCVATDWATSKQSRDIAAQHDLIFASAGIHPNHCHEAELDDWDSVCELARAQPEIVAIGETGLDRYWDFAPFDLQLDYFRRHIELSVETGKPIVVHMRDCHEDILACFADFTDGMPRGVMHSFVGDWDLAKKFLDLGLYISFSGMVTFKKNEELRKVAAQVPADRILVETDAPYLSPHPHRGERPNQPALVVHTGHCVAEARGVSAEEFAKQSTENARRLFKIDDII